MTEHVFRIDNFRVPEAIREEFLARIRETHAIIRLCEGFIRDDIFERFDGEGIFNIVTSVEWSGLPALDDAKRAVIAARQDSGFSPQDYMLQNNITPDFGLYRTLPVAP